MFPAWTGLCLAVLWAVCSDELPTPSGLALMWLAGVWLALGLGEAVLSRPAR